MNGCPERDLFERFLNDRLVDTDADGLEHHLEGCASCQKTLEEMSDDRRWVSELRHEVTLLRDDGKPDALVDPLRAKAGSLEGATRSVPIVPGYEINGELGRGGMGVVDHARHVRLNRACALKMILAGAHASPDDVARFVTEAEAIARLEHPSIVQIHHIGDADGLPFLELEYLAGGSLDQQLDGTPWPTTRAARLAEQVALGIAEAHRQGIVHRDLKPSNVLLTADGAPKVGDFGLAKLLDSQAALTRSESIMGSPSDMAPEQAQGHAKKAGPAVDVYAVGAILYELLTGRPPFRGTTALETLEQVETTEPVHPSRLVPGVPPDIETICLKCLEKEPGKRYETAHALGDDLRRFLNGRTILARRTSGVERAWRWCRRNRLVAGMTGIAVALLLIVAIGSPIAAWRFHIQEGRTEKALREKSDAERQASLRAFDGFYLNLNEARATRFSRQMGQRFGGLAALERAVEIGRGLNLPPERFELLRDQAIACFALPDVKATGRVIEEPAGTWLWYFDSGMKRYALRLLSGAILVRRVADDQEVARFEARGERGIFVFAFSPGGRYLMTTHVPGRALTVWDVDRNTIAVAEPGPVAWAAARFSPDSRRIALAHPDGEVLIYDLETDRPSRFPSGVKDVQDLAFRPDGLQIAVTNLDAKQPTCRILEAESGQVVRTIPLRSPGVVAWSPDGATLVAAGLDLKIDLWDAPSGILKARLEGSTGGGLHATFLPAGKLLASNGWESFLQLWDAVLGRPVLTLTGETSLEPEFSLGGQIVLRSGDRLTTYQVDPALEYRALVHVSSEPMSFHRPSIRRDNRLMAVGSDTGVVLWDLARGTECGFLPIGGARSVMFEASGDLLTSGTAGVQRWRVQLDSDRSEFRVGPSRDLLFSRHSGHIAEDRLGRIIATPRHTLAEVQISERLIRLEPLDECRYVAVSPDGEWLATGSHRLGAQVWRVGDAEKVAELPVNRGTAVAFSPDGRWLMTAIPPCKLWTTGTWARLRELGGMGLCFSPDSRLVALRDASQIIRLVEAETGRVIARLESPDAGNVIWATFSPDGSRLVLVPDNNPAVYVWDLRAICKRLAAMGLDWEAPAYSDDHPAASPLPPFQVDLGALSGEIERVTESGSTLLTRYTARLQNDPGDALARHHRGHALYELGRVQEAIDDFEVALRLCPDDAHLRAVLAESCDNLAWRLAYWPGSATDAERALPFARRAVELAPNHTYFVNTLGIALYRAGQYAEAIAILKHCLAGPRGGHGGFEHFYLAMAHHRHGEREQARACLDRALGWVKSQPRLGEQWTKLLADLRTEAEAVLAGPAAERPVDVGTPSR